MKQCQSTNVSLSDIIRPPYAMIPGLVDLTTGIIEGYKKIIPCLGEDILRFLNFATVFAKFQI